MHEEPWEQSILHPVDIKGVCGNICISDAICQIDFFFPHRFILESRQKVCHRHFSWEWRSQEPELEHDILAMVLRTSPFTRTSPPMQLQEAARGHDTDCESGFLHRYMKKGRCCLLTQEASSPAFHDNAPPKDSGCKCSPSLASH